MEDQSNSSSRKRARDLYSDELELESAEVKRLRDDLLSFLDDSDPELGTQDLDSVMRSFQEEIESTVAEAGVELPSPVEVVDLTSEPGESRSELGYLLEASDDELGLPPTDSAATSGSSGENVLGEAELLFRVASESSGVGEFWEFEDQIPSYDSFVLGAGEAYAGEYVAFDGLFEYSDECFEPSSDPSGFLWRRDTLPTL